MAKKLTLEETKELLIAWRELEDKEALFSLVMSNSGLVIFFVKKYLNQGLTFEELKSAGNEGMIKAIDKFNYIERPMEGFSSYISVAIENQIKQELKSYRKYYSKIISFEQPIGQSKDGDELKVEDIVGTDAEEILEDIISSIKIDIVRDALKCLTSREQQIILLRYGLDEIHRKTQGEVAEMFGCTKSLISKQEQKALIKMRHPRNTRKLKDFIEE